ncbi:MULTISPECIES: hypothetical protein [Nostocales]|uniref:Uncharacterized protein n=3 Tax=Nostocales TaxID=1161 RepID=A0A0C1NE25_9CYAN|nr:hypothetical protein [Tolypothrix bouteillei]KAF3887057.1 hypothetical protein DA73_0400017355 [Tolypothrix bouteillei VB521301]
MGKFFLPPLPPDDQPSRSIHLDVLLHRQLEETICQKFYKACGPIMRFLLSSCHWYFTINAGTLTLLIICYDLESYWHIANVVPDIFKKLKLFSNSAKIRLCPPTDKGVPWEVGMDEV